MKKVWIDTDMGIDDSIALIIAQASQNLDIIGVSTVYGNFPIEEATQNALDILFMVNREDIPVYQGASKPLLKKPFVFDGTGYHGETLGNAEIKKSKKLSVVENSFGQIYTKFMESNEKISIVAIGPITNIAILLRSFPQIKDKIEDIYFLGGSIHGGNVTTFSEFNVYSDPEALQVVLNENLNFYMMPIDSCQDLAYTEKDVNSINDSNFKKIVKQFLNTYIDSCKEMQKEYQVVIQDFHNKYIMYDPIMLAVVRCPNIATIMNLNVQVELSHSLTYGATYIDKLKGAKPNCKLITNVNKKQYFDILFESIEKIDKVSPYNN